MPGREYIELGGFGVLEDGVLKKFDQPEKVEETVEPDPQVDKTEDIPAENGEEGSE